MSGSDDPERPARAGAGTVGVIVCGLALAKLVLHVGVNLRLRVVSRGALYLATGRSLWAPIVAHGVHDTLGFMLVFLGRYPRM